MTQKRKVIVGIIVLSLAVLIVIGRFAWLRLSPHFDIDFMWEFATYNHIQYNGIDYYQTKDQNQPYNNSGEQVVIHLVDGSSKVDYKHHYYASSYEGDKDLKYLFFDGAVYVQGKYLDLIDSHMLNH